MFRPIVGLRGQVQGRAVGVAKSVNTPWVLGIVSADGRGCAGRSPSRMRDAFDWFTSLRHRFAVASAAAALPHVALSRFIDVQRGSPLISVHWRSTASMRSSPSSATTLTWRDLLLHNGADAHHYGAGRRPVVPGDACFGCRSGSGSGCGRSLPSGFNQWRSFWRRSPPTWCSPSRSSPSWRCTSIARHLAVVPDHLRHAMVHRLQRHWLGPTAFPNDLKEAAANFRIRGWSWWRNVMLPGHLPLLRHRRTDGLGRVLERRYRGRICEDGVTTRSRRTGSGAYIAAGDRSRKFSANRAWRRCHVRLRHHVQPPAVASAVRLCRAPAPHQLRA